MHLSRQLNCWSLRCSWSIACRRCSNYIFILYLTPGFNRLGKGKCKTRWESFRSWYLVRLILEILQYFTRFCPRTPSLSSLLVCNMTSYVDSPVYRQWGGTHCGGLLMRQLVNLQLPKHHQPHPHLHLRLKVIYCFNAEFVALTET